MAPTVTASDPVNNAVNVFVNKVIKITFSEAIKFGTNPWIELANSNGTAIPFTTSITGNVLSITPSSLLAYGTLHTIVIHSNAVTDLAGNGLALPYKTRFTTDTPP